MRCVLTITVLLLWGSPVNAQQQPSDSLQLTLPRQVYAVAGVPFSIYFDNIVLTEDSDQYRFEVACDVGTVESRRWTVTPSDANVGNHGMTVSVFLKEKLIESAETTLQILDSAAGKNHDGIRLLIIGDSLTHATKYPNEVARLLSQRDNPKWQMIGTHRPSGASAGVFHEGYGGWTWARFASHYEPEPDGTHRKRSSPFVYPGDNGKPSLNVPRYFDSHCDGTPPDYIVIMLGINDCFRAPPDSPAEIDSNIDTMLEHADTLLAAIQKAAPAAHVGVCLTTPPNLHQAAFTANYKDQYPRWGWKRIQHRLVQRQMQYVTKQQDANISMIPTQLNLDPLNGYPRDNGVHPNDAGYKDIGTTIYSWLKWQLAHEPTSQPQRAGKTAKPLSPVLQPIEDTLGLPRVLLIGDSISMGYTLPVRALLKGKANVHRIRANGGPTTRGLANIDRWLGDDNWDVIHFNWGIHDLKHMPNGLRQVEAEDYAKNLRTLLARLQKTNAKLIWASTTPIPKGKLNPHRTFGDETEYNTIAAKIMKADRIAINDLHGYVMPKFAELHKPMDLHFEPAGSQFLAEQVAKVIQQHLPQITLQSTAP